MDLDPVFHFLVSVFPTEDHDRVHFRCNWNRMDCDRLKGNDSCVTYDRANHNSERWWLGARIFRPSQIRNHTLRDNGQESVTTVPITRSSRHMTKFSRSLRLGQKHCTRVFCIFPYDVSRPNTIPYDWAWSVYDVSLSSYYLLPAPYSRFSKDGLMTLDFQTLRVLN
jgi:hypothetical protein